MTARRRTFRCRAAMTRVATILIVAGAPITADAQTSNRQALMIGGTWSGWIDSARVAQSTLSTGAISTQVSIQTSYLAAPLLNLIAASIAGKLPSTSLVLSTFSSTGSPVSLVKVGYPRIQEVDLPAADTRNTAPILVGVKFVPATAELGTPGSYPGPNPSGQALHSNYFHLQFDSLDATTAISIAPMSLVLTDVLKGILPYLVLTTAVTTSTSPVSSQLWATGVQKWLQSQTTKSGTLTFLASDFKTPLLVVRFAGVRVKSIVNTTTNPVVTFTMTGIGIQGAAMY